MTDWFTNVDPMHKIIDGVYLGNYLAASDKELLLSHGITHILRVVKEEIGDVFPSDFTYKFMELRDIPEQNISSHFKEAHKFIDDALKGSNALKKKNKVLVHCHAGVSRSSTIVISYLMKRYINFSFKEAFNFVKSKRSIIHPNSGFVKQLKTYEKELKRKLLKSDSVSSFTSRVSNDSTKSADGGMNFRKADAIDMLQTTLTRKSKLDHFKPPNIMSSRSTGHVPSFTPFINKEKEKLYSTLNSQESLRYSSMDPFNNQNPFAPVDANYKPVVRTPTVLQSSGLDIMKSSTFTPRTTEQYNIHPSVYRKQKKSQFCRERDLHHSIRDCVPQKVPRKKYYTPQRISVKAAGMGGYNSQNTSVSYNPASVEAPAWSTKNLPRMTKKRGLVKSYSSSVLPQVMKKRVTFDI